MTKEQQEIIDNEEKLQVGLLSKINVLYAQSEMLIDQADFALTKSGALQMEALELRAEFERSKKQLAAHLFASNS